MKMQQSMEEAKGVAKEVDKEFGQVFGRSYGIMEEFLTEDADILLVTCGTITGAARAIVDEYRKKGEKVGLLKMRMFRPFPSDDVRQVLTKARKVLVIDRNISLGATGILSQEVRSALQTQGEGTSVFGFIAGLGGRDVTPENLQEMVEYAKGKGSPEGDITWIGAMP